MAKQKNKGGRPRLADARQTISIRLNDDERSALAAKADELGLPASTWARLALRRALGLTSENLP